MSEDTAIHPEPSQDAIARSDARIANPLNLINLRPAPHAEIRPMSGRVIGSRSPHIPPMVKAIVAECSKTDMNKTVEEAFDVSHTRVTEARATVREDIRGKALDAVASMFETVLTREKLGSMDIKDATKAAKDLTTIAEKVQGRGPTFNGPTIIVYSPAGHTEDEYNVIDVDGTVQK